MKIGIVGKPQSGKSTVFRALCGGSQIDMHGGVCQSRIDVPDSRIDKLAELYQPQKVTNVKIDFVDFGNVFESKTGMKSDIAAKIREMDALAIVIGAYAAANPNVVITEIKDTIEEFLLQDQIQIEKSLERVRKEHKNPQLEALLSSCLQHLEGGGLLSQLTFSEFQQQLLSGYRFFTQKPFFMLINENEKDYNRTNYPDLNTYCETQHIALFRLAAPLEEDLSQLPRDEQAQLLADFNFTEPAKDRFLAAAYSSLNLISFFTVGKDEVRAWSIPKSTVAVKAAGCIHSDIERGFIRAELMRYEDLLELRSESKVKEAGKWRLVGKEYVIQDGDVVNYRFNV